MFLVVLCHLCIFCMNLGKLEDCAFSLMLICCSYFLNKSYRNWIFCFDEWVESNVPKLILVSIRWDASIKQKKGFMYSLIWHNCTWVVFTNLLEIEVSGDPNSRTTIILLILLLMIMFNAFTFTYQPITLPIPLFENFLFLILVTCKWMNLWHRTSILQQAVRKDLLFFCQTLWFTPGWT